MTLRPDVMRELTELRDPSFDGRFLVGHPGRRRYCLVSCAEENRSLLIQAVFFARPAAARRAGLEPCPVCRPDEQPQRRQEELDLVDAALGCLEERSFVRLGWPSVCESLGVTRARLGRLFATTGRRAAAAELREARLRLAEKELLETERGPREIARSCGFESAAGLSRELKRHRRLDADALRRLRSTETWSIKLPSSFPFEAWCSYFERHAVAPHLRICGARLEVGCWVEDAPVRLEVQLEKSTGGLVAHCTVDPLLSERVTGAAGAHRIVLRLLGGGVESDHAALTRRLSALRGDRQLSSQRLPAARRWLSPGRWEAFLWAVAGQQVSLGVAGMLLTNLAAAYGVEVGGAPEAPLYAPPRPQDLSAVDADDLGRLKFSRQKSRTLVELSRRWPDFEGLGHRAQESAATVLEGVSGIGPWSAAYILMRGYDFVDVWPRGDAPLARAWGAVLGLEGKAEPDRVEAEMARLRPYRALATFQLWNSLAG